MKTPVASDVNTLVDQALALRATQPADAIEMLRRAVATDPRHLPSLRALAELALAANLFDLADDALQRIVAIEPEAVAAHEALGQLAFKANDMPRAARHFEAAWKVRALGPGSALQLATAYAVMDRYADARRICTTLLANPALPASIASQCLGLLGFDPGLSAAELAALHRDAMRRSNEIQAITPLPARAPLSHGGKIRVGYLSADFHLHVCANFLLAVLQHHDRARFEIICYSANPYTDGMTKRLKVFADRWHDISTLGDAQAAALIRADEIDILVDCNGHTQHNRLPVFAYRPAPIQVSYLGYPESTGLDAIEYRFSDPVIDPQGGTEAVRLPNGFLAYRPLVPECPDPRPKTENAPIVFGSFNNWRKIGPDVRGVWVEVLKRVPGSRLVLKDRQLGAPDLAAAVAAEFAAAGIAPERVEIRPFTKGQLQHLDEYNAMDIMLDAFPYSGTTTTCDSLWMGVPVITLRGERCMTRVSAAILTQIGLGDLVADTPADYVARAVALAADRPRLAKLRTTLRGTMAGAPIGLAAPITRDMETFYHAVAHGRPSPF